MVQRTVRLKKILKQIVLLSMERKSEMKSVAGEHQEGGRGRGEVVHKMVLSIMENIVSDDKNSTLCFILCVCVVCGLCV